jgi:FRG domain
MKPAKFSYQEGEPIRSVSHLLKQIQDLTGKGNFSLYFRGHAEPVHALVPSIGRSHYYLGRALNFDRNSEANLLNQFRKHAYEHYGRVPSEWENLFLARHHGLPTRLLDWTSNPLVALYFAAFYETDELLLASVPKPANRIKLDLDGTLWAIQKRPESDALDVLNQNRSPLKVPGIKLIHPFNPTPRMTVQSAFFTLHGDPWTDMVKSAGKPYRPRELDIMRLLKWKIHCRHKAGIILDLERLAINSRTLFPDLEGLAKGLWQTEVIRKCFAEFK